MKNKKLLASLFVAGGVAMCSLLGGCVVKGSESVENSDIRGVYNLYAAYAEERGEEVLDYGQWLESIKGADGKDGKDGKDGEKGEAGADGKDGKDGEKGEAGADGKDGKNGIDGEKGEAGAHVTGAKQVFMDRWKIGYYFEFELSDGSKVTTQSTAVINVNPAKEYKAETEEERETLRGYGVAEEKIKYEPVFDPAESLIKAPLAKVEIITDHGYFYSDTSLMGSWKTHTGIDLAAEEGEEVAVCRDGTIESIEAGKGNFGAKITVVHCEGLKSVYQFIDAKEGLQAGDAVHSGDIIGTVKGVTKRVDAVIENSGTVDSIQAAGEGKVNLKIKYTVNEEVEGEDGTTSVVTVDIFDSYSSVVLTAELQVGSEVTEQDVIGYTVINVIALEAQFGTHLHFEIIVNGESVDPRPFLGMEE